MKQTISFVTLGVSDLARSRKFYAALGWKELSGSSADVAFFHAGTVAVSLFPREALAEGAKVAPQGNGFPGLTLPHTVDPEAAVGSPPAEAAAAGATLVRPADKAFWGGFRGYFADPDGFLWEVCWNPFFPLDSEGHVQLPE